MKNLVRMAMWAGVAIVVVVAGIWGYRTLDSSVKDFDVVITPSVIPADNSSSAELEIRIISRFGHTLNVRSLPYAPKVELVEGANLVRMVSLGDSLTYRLIAGTETGSVVARVMIFGAPGPIEAKLELTPSLADRNRNGYPDLLDLTSESDRTSFRRWFTTIALGQLTHIDDRWHDRDCAGLLRYCYREALKRHDNTWLASRKWLVTGAIPDVRKYNYPNVPIVGTRVFNAGRRNAAEPGDDASGALPASNPPRRSSSPLDNFSDYAEAARLKDNSLAFLSRNPADALPGDVLIYLNDTDSKWPYHTMIYLGSGVTIYHTGPDGDKPGIVKKLSLAQLAQHPNPRWHPVAGNPYFLGFYRWRILL
jgi:uncharacterized protein YfaT (DUF1175 family)